MYAATGVTQYWWPMARGMITAVRLENMNTRMMFQNNTGSAQDVSLEIWVTCVGARHSGYSAMMNRYNSNRFACRALRYSTSIPTGSALRSFGNTSGGKSVRLKNNIPTNQSTGEIGYFDEDDYVGVYWVVRSDLGHTGTITVTPQRSTSVNSGYNRSGVTFSAIMSQELLN